MAYKQIEYRLAKRPAWCRVCGQAIRTQKDTAIFAIARSGQDTQIIICRNCVFDIIDVFQGEKEEE